MADGRWAEDDDRCGFRLQAEDPGDTLRKGKIDE
jgi:hypothetical protein